jgi:guanyl-specific ribonuclease Sa
MPCCDSGILEGGVIKSSDILGCEISSSTFASGQLDNIKVSNLTTLDEVSAKTIIEAFINSLSSTQLSALAEKIIGTIKSVGAPIPSASDAESLPTRMFGKRTILLGDPEKWIELGGGVVPCYTPESK